MKFKLLAFCVLAPLLAACQGDQSDQGELLKITSWGAREQLGGSNINGRPYYFNNKYVKITSLTDQITLNSVTVNRGNCGFNGSKFPASLKFGESFQVQLRPSTCEVVEIQVSTDHGDRSYQMHDASQG